MIEEFIQQAKAEIARLQAAVKALSNGKMPVPKVSLETKAGKPAKSKMSAKARKAISVAQKKRWAEKVKSAPK